MVLGPPPSFEGWRANNTLYDWNRGAGESQTKQTISQGECFRIYINRRFYVGQIENQRHTEAEMFALTHWEDISQSIEKGSHRSMRERKRGDVM